MKNRYFVFIFSVLCCISVFGNTDMQEEVDFLLFSPNSGSRFENGEQAFIQLNNLAQYLMSKNIQPGQIIVCGYAAYAPNDIKSADLSKERAVFVMNELQKRGVSRELFSDPVGYGAVYLWGNNDTENARKLNRRVRVLLDGESPMPITREIIAAEIEKPKAEPPIAVHRAEAGNPFIGTPRRVSYKFPWWVLPLLAFALLVLFVFLMLKLRPQESLYNTKAAKVQPRIRETVIVPVSKAGTYTVNLDEEIRNRAYEISRQRGGQEDYREQDWYNAVREISAWYTACGHSVYTEDGSWWASSLVEDSAAAGR